MSEQTRLKYKDHPDGKAPVVDIVKAVSVILLSCKLQCSGNDDFVNGRTDQL